MIKAIVILCSLSCGVSFTPQAFRRAIQASKSSISMASTMSPGKLNHIKERYGGRGEFDTIKDDDDDIASYSSFSEADSEITNPPTKGEMITGVVIEMDDNGALLEIGGKMSGYLPLKEASLIPIKHVNTVMNVGDSITAEVIGTLKGMPVISLRAAQLIGAWEDILNTRANDESFDVKVVEINKGGAICDAFGLKAFLPGSHILGIPDESLIGNTMTVKFLDVIEEEGKIVISQRKAKADSQTCDLVKYEVVSGTVTGLRNYGVFLEFEGGMSGLLHISQISYDRVDNLEEVFSIGQTVKVMIIDHDKVNNRVALSTKTLEPNPGDMLRDMESVFKQAEETAKKYVERMDQERKAREETAKDIVAGLGGAMDNADSDPLVSVADSIESILASIVSDSPDAEAAEETAATESASEAEEK